MSSFGELLKKQTKNKQDYTEDVELHKLRTLFDVARNLAHDINSPLSVVKDTITYIRRVSTEYNDIVAEKSSSKETDPPFKDIKNILKRVQLETESAVSAVNRSIFIANTLREQIVEIFNKERQEFDIRERIEKMLKLNDKLGMILEKYKCACTVVGDIDTKMVSYPEQLMKVLFNLIKNAAESYSHNLLENNKIQILLEQTDKYFLIGVKDFGCGVPEVVKDLIFYKPVQHLCLKQDASGLSLFIAPLIVVGILEGEIWFETKENEGTTFYMSLPISCAEKKLERPNEIKGVGLHATRRNAK